MSALLRTATVATATLLLLTGCAPGSPLEPTDTPVAPIETVTPVPDVPDPAIPDFSGQEQLTISATATAPNGAVLDLSMVVYYPVTPDSTEGGQVAEYLSFVGDTSDVASADFIASKLAVYQVSALTVTASGPTWPSDVGVLPALGPGQTDTIVGVPADRIGGNRLSINGAGSGYGVAALYSGDGSPATTPAWADRFTYYGFMGDFGDAVLSECNIHLSAAAQGNPAIANWGQFDCFTGIGD